MWQNRCWSPTRSIFDFYRTGKLQRPHDIPINVFIREVQFYEIQNEIIPEEYLKLPQSKIKGNSDQIYARNYEGFKLRVRDVIESTVLKSVLPLVDEIILPDRQSPTGINFSLSWKIGFGLKLTSWSLMTMVACEDESWSMISCDQSRPVMNHY